MAMDTAIKQQRGQPEIQKVAKKNLPIPNAVRLVRNFKNYPLSKWH